MQQGAPSLSLLLGSYEAFGVYRRPKPFQHLPLRETERLVLSLSPIPIHSI